jgi:hypothetical protein
MVYEILKISFGPTAGEEKNPNRGDNRHLRFLLAEFVFYTMK